MAAAWIERDVETLRTAMIVLPVQNQAMVFSVFLSVWACLLVSKRRNTPIHLTIEIPKATRKRRAPGCQPSPVVARTMSFVVCDLSGLSYGTFTHHVHGRLNADIVHPALRLL